MINRLGVFSIILVIVFLFIVTTVLYKKQNVVEKYFENILALQAGEAQFETLARLQSDVAKSVTNVDNNTRGIANLKASNDDWNIKLNANLAQFQKDANTKLENLQGKEKTISKTFTSFNPRLATLDESQNAILNDTQVLNGNLVGLHNLVTSEFASYDQQLTDVTERQHGMKTKFDNQFNVLVTDAYNDITNFQTSTRSSLEAANARIGSVNKDLNSWGNSFVNFKDSSTSVLQKNHSSIQTLKQDQRNLSDAILKANDKIDNVKDLLGGFVTKSDTNNFLNKSDMTNYPSRSMLGTYATKSDIGAYASQQEIDNYTLRTDFQQSIIDSVSKAKDALDALKANVDVVSSQYVNTPTFNKRVVELTGSDKIRSNLDDARKRLDGVETNMSTLPNNYVPYAQFTSLAENSIGIPAFRKAVEDLQNTLKVSQTTLANIQSTYLDKSKIGTIAVEATGSTALSNRISTALADLSNLTNLVNNINSNYVTKANLPQLAKDASGVATMQTALDGTNAQLASMNNKLISLEKAGYVTDKDLQTLAIKATGSDILKSNIDALSKTIADSTSRLSTLEKEYVTRKELISVAATPARVETIATAVSSLNETVKKINNDMNMIKSQNYVKKTDVVQLATDATGVIGSRESLKTLTENVNKLSVSLDVMANVVTKLFVTKADFAEQMKGYLMKTELANYAVKNDFTAYASRVEGEGVTKTLMNTYIPKQDVHQNYALKTDVANIISKSDLNTRTQHVLDSIKALRTQDELCISGMCLNKDEWARIKESVAPKNCILSDWSAWSACDDKTGKKRRTRTITQQPMNGGAPCNAMDELADCDPVDCVLSQWSACSTNCGTGTQSRTIVTQPRYGGRACDTLSQSCTSVCPGLYSFTTYTFSSCGAKGRLGPTIQQCRSTYNTSWAQNTSFFNMTSQGIQEWTVPITGRYWITAAGAAGGFEILPGPFNQVQNPTRGYGATLSASFSLNQGQKIYILVGQAGGVGTTLVNDINRLLSFSGGGGSFVATGNNVSTSTPLIIAGGGGGGNRNRVWQGFNSSDNPSNASYTETGNAGWTNGRGWLGNAGNSGNGGSIVIGGGAGAGWRGNGAASDDNRYSTSTTPMSFINGGAGGYGGMYLSGNDGTSPNDFTRFGGFGGGASGAWGGSGGGGGYSGGGSDANDGFPGGGGSFVNSSGTNRTNGSWNDGYGYVTIKLIT